MELITRRLGDSENEKPIWKVGYITQAVAEGRKILTPEQYEHAAQQIEELAFEPDPTHPRVGDVRALEGFHELRDKGGLLGKINLRIFFWVCKALQTIIVLGVYKKEEEDQTPVRIVMRMKSRLRCLTEYVGSFVQSRDQSRRKE